MPTAIILAICVTAATGYFYIIALVFSIQVMHKIYVFAPCVVWPNDLDLFNMNAMDDLTCASSIGLQYLTLETCNPPEQHCSHKKRC